MKTSMNMTTLCVLGESVLQKKSSIMRIMNVIATATNMTKCHIRRAAESCHRSSYDQLHLELLPNSGGALHLSLEGAVHFIGQFWMGDFPRHIAGNNMPVAYHCRYLFPERTGSQGCELIPGAAID